MGRRVKIGQVWDDMDNRPPGRAVRVVDDTGTHAVVEVVEHPNESVIGRRTVIRKKRMKPGSRGYRLRATHQTREDGGG